MANVAEILIQARDQTGGAFKSVESSLGKLQKNTEMLSTAMKTAFTALAVKEIYDFGKKVSDAGEEIGKASQKTGIAVGEMAILKDAAYMADVEFEGLQNAAKKLATAMYEASNGNQETAKTFAGLNVETKNADGTLRPINEVLQTLSDRFSKMPNGAEKSALAVKLFGKAGTDMIPMLNDMGGAIEKAKRFGAVWTEKDVEDANAVNDAEKELVLTFNKLLKEVVLPLLPTITKVVEQFAGWASKTDNMDALTKVFGGTLKGIALIVIELGAQIYRSAYALGTFGAVIAKVVTGQWSDIPYVLKQSAHEMDQFNNSVTGLENILLGANPVITQAKQTLKEFADIPQWKPPQPKTDTPKTGTDKKEKSIHGISYDEGPADAQYKAYLEFKEKEEEESVKALAAKLKPIVKKRYDEEMKAFKEDYATKYQLYTRLGDAARTTVDQMSSTLANWAANSKMNISQVWDQMRSSMISYFVEQAAQWALNWALSSAYKALDLAAVQAMGVASAEAWATAAAFAATATAGASAATGAAALTAAVAEAHGMAAFAEGTDYIPRTGLALLHKGEAVTPAHMNPMNPDNKFSGAKKREKRQEVVINIPVTLDGYELGRALRRMDSHGLLNLKKA